MPVPETSSELANTILMCGLRRSEGIELSRLLPLITDGEKFIQEVRDKYCTEGMRDKYFSRIDEGGIALSEREGFLVSNHLISDIMIIMENYLKK